MSNARFDQNYKTTLLGVSSVEYGDANPTLVNLAANPTTGALLIDGDSLYPQLDTRYLQISNNLSDLNDAATARTNLGISAVNTPITDSGDYYTGTEVETALQEIGDGTTLDSRYLLLDQTTPQTVSNGAPIFSGGLKTGQINAIDGTGLKLYDDAGNGISVDDGGNVGIGTSGNAAKFAVFNTVAGRNAFRLEHNDSTYAAFVIVNYGANGYGIYDTAAKHYFSGTIQGQSNQYLLGNLAVGASSTTAQLGVYPTSATTIAHFIKLASGQTANALEARDSSNAWLFGFDADGNFSQTGVFNYRFTMAGASKGGAYFGLNTNSAVDGDAAFFSAMSTATGSGTLYTFLGYGTTSSNLRFLQRNFGTGGAEIAVQAAHLGGDAFISMTIPGQQEAILGIDNSDSDRFKFGWSYGFTNNVVFYIEPTKIFVYNPNGFSTADFYLKGVSNGTMLFADASENIIWLGGTNTGLKVELGGVTSVITSTPLAFIIGYGAAGVDYQMKFDGETNDGTLTYKEDEDELDFDMRITHPGTFGEIYVADGSTAQTIPTGATYTKLTGFATDGQSSNCTNDAANDKITITKTGRYEVICSIGASSNTVSTFKFAAFLNGVEQSQVHTHRKYANANDVGACTLSGIIDVTTASWDLDVRAAHDAVGDVDFTPTYMNLSVVYLGET